MVRPSKVGVVVSQGKMDKTVKVRIRNTSFNRHVSKTIVSHRNMLVHDELNKCREGDVVRVQYVRPLSARKSWAVAEFIRLQGTSWEKYQQEIPNEVRSDEISKLEKFQQLRQARESNQPTGELKIDVLDAEISEISSKLNKLDFKAAEARRIVDEEPERANSILCEMGKPQAAGSMRRNIIKRYLERQSSQ